MYRAAFARPGGAACGQRGPGVTVRGDTLRGA